ncbi:unnamed protein product [Acanthoscelides obtectus]|uniref:Uncharacterized protein n=1 Tax=Acanthoscelides obtectus TaxID=200917 RepID=A0A9P0LBU7_ACAOB|nr:unnamed protein product [Acanthoscelides obtectus]CAK1649599.1 hypothetical protein AOBTE_LOCUS16324 [Acanthoscelides obtectus]
MAGKYWVYEFIKRHSEVHNQQSSTLHSQRNKEAAAEINKANEELHALLDSMDKIEEFQSYISLIDISPLPKAIHIQTRRQNPSMSEMIINSPLDMKTKSNPKKKYNIKKDKATDKSLKQEYYFVHYIEKSTEIRLKCGLSAQFVNLGGTKPVPVTRVAYLLMIYVQWVKFLLCVHFVVVAYT